MVKEWRCIRCRTLLAVERDGKIEILCVHRGRNTCGKCDTVNVIPMIKK